MNILTVIEKHGTAESKFLTFMGLELWPLFEFESAVNLFLMRKCIVELSIELAGSYPQ